METYERYTSLFARISQAFRPHSGMASVFCASLAIIVDVAASIEREYDVSFMSIQFRHDKFLSP